MDVVANRSDTTLVTSHNGHVIRSGDVEKEKEIERRMRELGLWDRKRDLEKKVHDVLDKRILESDGLVRTLRTCRRSRDRSAVQDLRNIIRNEVVRDCYGQLIAYRVDVLIGQFTHDVTTEVEPGEGNIVIIRGNTHHPLPQRLSKEIRLDLPPHLDMDRIKMNYIAGVVKICVPYKPESERKSKSDIKEIYVSDDKEKRSVSSIYSMQKRFYDQQQQQQQQQQKEQENQKQQQESDLQQQKQQEQQQQQEKDLQQQKQHQQQHLHQQQQQQQREQNREQQREQNPEHKQEGSELLKTISKQESSLLIIDNGEKKLTNLDSGQTIEGIYHHEETQSSKEQNEQYGLQYRVHEDDLQEPKKSAKVTSVVEQERNSSNLVESKSESENTEDGPNRENVIDFDTRHLINTEEEMFGVNPSNSTNYLEVSSFRKEVSDLGRDSAYFSGSYSESREGEGEGHRPPPFCSDDVFVGEFSSVENTADEDENVKQLNEASKHCSDSSKPTLYYSNDYNYIFSNFSSCLSEISQETEPKNLENCNNFKVDLSCNHDQAKPQTDLGLLAGLELTPLVIEIPPTFIDPPQSENSPTLGNPVLRRHPDSSSCAHSLDSGIFLSHEESRVRDSDLLFDIYNNSAAENRNSETVQCVVDEELKEGPNETLLSKQHNMENLKNEDDFPSRKSCEPGKLYDQDKNSLLDSSKDQKKKLDMDNYMSKEKKASWAKSLQNDSLVMDDKFQTAFSSTNVIHDTDISKDLEKCSSTWMLDDKRMQSMDCGDSEHADRGEELGQRSDPDGCTEVRQSMLSPSLSSSLSSRLSPSFSEARAMFIKDSTSNTYRPMNQVPKPVQLPKSDSHRFSFTENKSKGDSVLENSVESSLGCSIPPSENLTPEEILSNVSVKQLRDVYQKNIQNNQKELDRLDNSIRAINQNYLRQKSNNTN